MLYADAIGRALEWARRRQQDDGKWEGLHRSWGIAPFLAGGLKMIGESPDSRVIKDICDYLESCVASDGGLSLYPGEPSSMLGCVWALPVLEWARPRSDAIRLVREYMRERHLDPDGTSLPRQINFRWVFHDKERAEIVATPLPPRALRVAASAFVSTFGGVHGRWKARMAEPGAMAKAFPRRYRPPPRWAIGAVGRILAYVQQPAGDPMRWQTTVSQPMLWTRAGIVTEAALVRKLGGHDSAEDRRLYNYAREVRESVIGRLIYEDGSYDACPGIFSDMMFTHAFGMEEAYRNACVQIQRVKYVGDGWADGSPALAYSVLDTGLTVSALREVGVKSDDPMLARAADYLREARAPSHGGWGYQYWRGMGRGRPPMDTDDCGIASMALQRAGEPIGSPIFRRCAEAVAELQDERGWFSTWGDGTELPNYPYIENSCRGLEVLLCAGFTREHARVRTALDWILQQQLADGSWCGGWLVRYIPGTIVALEALLFAGECRPGDPPIERAVRWLLKEQHADGGWGEDWFGGSAPSTTEHTALAILGLCWGTEGLNGPREAIRAGVRWLLEHQRPEGNWDASLHNDYGFGVPGCGCANMQMSFAYSLSALGVAQRALSGT